MTYLKYHNLMTVSIGSMLWGQCQQPGTILGKGCRVYGQATVGGTFPDRSRIRPDVALKVTQQR